MSGRGMRFLPVAPRERSRMEFALPTINVIFLLMLYFLLAGTLAEENELGVALPQTMQAPTDRLPRPLLLMSADGQLVLDGVVVTDANVGEASRAAIATAGVAEINLLVPRDLAAAPFLRLLARLEDAKVPIRLVTVEHRADEVSP